MRRGLPILALWGIAAIALSVITTRVADWYVMTDELLYERLAISIGRTFSPLPQLHGVVVHSFSQLYPLLIAPAFAHGYVPDDLRTAHLFNAWIMASACIPAYLLVRRVTGREWAAYLVAALSVFMPWIFYAPFLLTEVAAYPVFLWVLLALQAAVVAPKAQNDALALLALVLAYFARTQFAVLLLVLPLAILAAGWSRRPLRETLRAHRVLAAGYAALAVAAVALAAFGRLSSALGTYSATAGGHSLPRGFARSLLEHVATLSLGVGILPFVVGLAWMLANLVRRPDDGELRAFACLGSIAAAALVVEVTIYDLRFGAGFVHDRYLFYLVPVVLAGFVCALLDPRRPRYSLLASAGLVAAGFAVGGQPRFVWSGLYPDTPISAFYDLLDRSVESVRTDLLLVVATLALTGFFVLASVVLRRAHLTALMLVLVAFAVPAETVYVFHQLFSADGWSYRPLTHSNAGVLDWVDRTVGKNGRVAMVPYPISTDFFESQRFWRDLEFWNVAVDRDVQYPVAGVFQPTGDTFPKAYPRFDPATGVSDVSPAPYAAHAEKETRFRIAGSVRANRNGVLLIRADQPWRTDWLTSGLYADGWTRPGKDARVRVFAEPGQRGARTRYVTFQVWAPDGVSRRYEVDSNLRRVRGEVTSPATARTTISVCVPPRGFSEVRLRTPASSPIPGDLSSLDAQSQPRRGGVFLAQVALADETGPACRT